MAVLKVKDGSSSWHNIDSIKGDKGDTGTSIVSVTKTGSQGLIDIYTITFSDGTTTTFQVKNGENGQGSGSVTSVDTGVGLTGGAITSSGTIKADLVSDTYSTEESEAITQTSGRQYAVNPDANGKLSVNVPWTDEGKTYTAGTNVQISSSNVISATDTTYESKTAVSGGTAVSLVTTGEKYTWNQAEPNVQSDWNATSGDAKILNKPTNVSAFTNDAGYLTSFTETDPTVPSWAKQSSKPTYTASEVGALPDTTSIPSKTSDLTNDSGFITSSAVPTKTSDLTNDSGFITSSALPTKTSDLTNDSNFVADASYVHTDNNYTSTEKSKLSGIAAGAEVNVQSDWNQTTTTADDYIKNKPTSETAASGGTTLSLVTTGEKYTWNSGLKFLGNNPINNINDDTYDSWYALGTGYAYYNTGSLLHGQKSTSGFLLNFVSEIGTVTQTWYTRGAGRMFVRSCEVSGDPMPIFISNDGVFVYSSASFSSLPQTFADDNIKSSHVCLKAELSTPSAQTSDWTVTTSSGSVTISGSISGSTSVTLYLVKSDAY